MQDIQLLARVRMAQSAASRFVRGIDRDRPRTANLAA
jgi:hypothetical protein